MVRKSFSGERSENFEDIRSVWQNRRKVWNFPALWQLLQGMDQTCKSHFILPGTGTHKCKAEGGELVPEQESQSCWLCAAACFSVSPCTCYPNVLMTNELLRVLPQSSALTSLCYEPHVREEAVL